jgi:S-adenosylmethionine synthetase
MKPDFIFTSVSVTSGHPDKLCDLASDAILDAYMIQDPAARVAAECALASGVLFLSTRVHAKASVDLADVVRKTVLSAGYSSDEFSADNCSVMINHGDLQGAAFPRILLDEKEPAEITRLPASHSITLFGYACRQTVNYMPLPVVLCHRLTHNLEQQITGGGLQGLSADGQVQVSVAYRQRKPVGIHSVNLLTSPLAREGVRAEQLQDELMESVINPVLSESTLPKEMETSIAINPDGVAVGGGPHFHSGLTGRKTGIDTYGEYARNCSAALSGKDPLRIDRIGVYAARQAAKHVVAAGLADECELLLSYAAGHPDPVSIRVHTYGTGQLQDEEISQRVARHFDFRPGVLAATYNLQNLPREREGFYRRLAVYGHLGREDLDTPWEALDRVDEFRSRL